MKYLHDLLSKTADGVFAVDRRQRVAFWNEGARRVLGFGAESVCGRQCFEVLRGADERGRVVCDNSCTVFHAASRGACSDSRDVQVRVRDGSKKWVNMTTLLLPSDWPGLSLLIHLFRDVGRSRQLPCLLQHTVREGSARSHSPAVSSPLDPLTDREIEILRLLAAGSTTRSICNQLRIGTPTVRTHVHHILSKLGVHSRLEAVAWALRNGLLGKETNAPGPTHRS